MFVILAGAVAYAVLFAGIGGLILRLDDSWQELAIEGFVVGAIVTGLMVWIRATSDRQNWPPSR